MPAAARRPGAKLLWPPLSKVCVLTMPVNYTSGYKSCELHFRCADCNSTTGGTAAVCVLT